MAAEDEVRSASARFYGALNGMLDGDNTPMADIWSRDASITAFHPIGGRQTGWDEVRESFAGVAGLASGGRVELRDQSIHAAGDMAYETGIEHGEATLAGEQIGIDQRVTNVYRREAGGWKVVHHHTDLSPAMLELLARLQQAA